MKNYCVKEGYKINRLENEPSPTYWDEQNIAFNKEAPQYYVYQTAYKLARRLNVETVLDVGCGTGRMLKHFFSRGFKVYGVDQESGVLLSRKNFSAGSFVAENLANPQYQLKSQLLTSPVIICADVIEHIEDPDKLLDYIKTFSNKNTRIVLSTPERNRLYRKDSNQPANPYHIREWSFEEFRAYIASSGFTVLEHKVILPFGLKFNLSTLRYILGQTMKGLALRYTQVIVCQIK